MSVDENKKHVSVEAQYVKDLSFENPGAPASLTKTKSAPQIDLSLDIEVHKLSDDNIYEVVLNTQAKALIEGQTLFLVELKYAGIFTLRNFDDAQKSMMLAVYAPSILFPFARKIIADATQSGGFQPLMIDPIDFASLYEKKLAQDNLSKTNNPTSPISS
jgi:preprotein translocase subunit SecB